MTVLWTSPVPSSAYIGEVKLVVRPGRTIALCFNLETETGAPDRHELRFTDVVAYKVTFYPALTVAMLDSAYEQLVDLGRTGWWKEVSAAVAQFLGPRPLVHMRICYDDGPCYDIICSGHEVA